ncbi:glycosyltransferase family 4 protein [Aquisalimonas sp. 2447]|uniref:glycosyltransferase family 4 protein n=1 Tax=Aquisalimonas sp. 2447 TaxID=2740807 RepID=UPI0020C3BABF|nr:glycosyltransferase family 4 protein [Aquisalimonas sp. 2447]
MKLLIVVNDFGFFMSHRLPVARAAAAAGWEVHVATAAAPNGTADDIRREEFSHHVLPLSRSGIHPFAEAKTVSSLFALYRRLQPEVVHHVTIKPVLYGGILARLAGRPAVVSAISGLGYLFGTGSGGRRLIRQVAVSLYKLALRHENSRVIFQNPDDRASLESMGIVQPDQAVMIPGSGVALETFKHRPEPEGPPVVVLPARMLYEKGVAEFVEAAREVRAQAYDVRFVLVGGLDPDNPASVSESTIRAWICEGVVEWWDYCEDMPAVLAGANLVVLPSYYGEGLPKALIEAAASGRAIVTTDHPGCRDAVRHGDNGLLVPVRDSGRLASAIKALLDDPEERRRMGRRGRERAETEFSEESVVEKHLEIYQSLLESATKTSYAEKRNS